ncbi:MAG: hypothetical protein HETSPECPRED_005550 [Heterodermia speciosa]|uniref:Uncharacterized protein n=1 Tax=Heterodermia speciosa TaxID=116794 RepID=A0A8H3FIH0_9LECA|nr:MAG: hypothetical protein HETSPECPRED_005550 [Heterodermia speciosa]
MLMPSGLGCSKSEPIISKRDIEPKTDPVQPAADRRRIAYPNLQKLENSVARRSAKLPISLSPIAEEGNQSRNSIHVTHYKVDQPALHFSTYGDKFLDSSQERAKQPTWPTDDLSEEISLDPFAIEDSSKKGGWLDGPLQIMADSNSACDKFLLAGEKLNSNYRKRFSELDEASSNALFDFNLQQDDVPVISPRRNAWDWTPGDCQIGDIGIALSSLSSMDDEGRWLDEMDIT